MKSTYLTPKEIHILGVQRTGQHAVIAWTIGHFNQVCFKNGFISRKTEGNHRGLTPPWFYFDTVNRPNFKREENRDRLIRTNQDAIILGTEFMNAFPKFCIDLDHEDRMKKKMVEEMRLDAFSKNRYYLGVLRSPWNHLASVLSWKPRYFLKRKDRFIRAWLMMAREYIGKTNDLPNPSMVVNFDLWFESKKYRKKISKFIGAPFSDKGLNVVMPMGRGRVIGSSFDRMAFNGKGNQMKVTERWREHLDNPTKFRDFLAKNEELVETARQIFGPFPKELNI